jgi:uncharacterized protein
VTWVTRVTERGRARSLRAMLKLSWLFPLALSLPLMTGCGASAPPPNAASAGAPCAGAGGNDGLDALTDDQLARKILVVTGAADLGKQVASSMMDSLSKMPNMPPGFLERFKQDMRVDELTELIVPIYLKHYDRATMIAAIRFYQSDQGKRMIQALPQVTAESTEAGKAWGMALAKKALGDMGMH